MPHRGYGPAPISTYGSGKLVKLNNQCFSFFKEKRSLLRKCIYISQHKSPVVDADEANNPADDPEKAADG